MSLARQLLSHGSGTGSPSGYNASQSGRRPLQNRARGNFAGIAFERCAEILCFRRLAINSTPTSGSIIFRFSSATQAHRIYEMGEVAIQGDGSAAQPCDAGAASGMTNPFCPAYGRAEGATVCE